MILEDCVRTLLTVLTAALLGGAACAPVTGGFAEGVEGVDGEAPAVAREATSESRQPPAPPPTPLDAPPGPKGDAASWHRAISANGERIVVSRESRSLWLIQGDSVIMAARIAVGRDTIFEYRGKSYDFSTPSGRMVVQGKETSPLWIPPDWHYFEKAVEQDLEPYQLRNDSRVELSDGTVIEVRGGEVGRINQFGNWLAFRPGMEIIFDDRIFIPPFGSPQRKIPEILGTHRLILGDGYLIHGTPEEDSIGEYASHGCVRMFNRDVERLYGMVDPGMPVYVY